MKLLQLSVIILAHKANQKLFAAIDSVNWADEVIIIWAGTQVPAELKEFQTEGEVKIIEVPPVISDFAALRNEAMSHAQHEWVFFLDSDEVVTQESLPVLQECIKKETAEGFTVKRLDVFLGETLNWGEVGDVRLLRLFKKTRGHFVRPVHEAVELQGKAEASQIILKHFAHDSLSIFLDKIIFYVQIEKRLRLEKGEKTHIFQLLLWPMGKFVFNYVLRLGFLDGWRGLMYATVMSIHSFAVRALVYESKSS